MPAMPQRERVERLRRDRVETARRREQRLAQAVRQAGGAELDVLGEPLDEERVARRARRDAGCDVGLGLAAEQRREQVVHRALLEALELDEDRARAARDVRERLARRRGQHLDRGAAGRTSRSRSSRMARTRKRRTSSVERSAHCRSSIATTSDPRSRASAASRRASASKSRARASSGEGAVSGCGRERQLGHERVERWTALGAELLEAAGRQGLGDAAQHARHRQVGRRDGQLDAGAERDERASRLGRPGELAHQGGLADPGLARDEGDRRRAPGRAAERVLEGEQLCAAAHERSRSGSAWHRARATKR